MFCPLKFNSVTLNAAARKAEGGTCAAVCQCEGEQCAWWERFTGGCAVLTQAFLAGVGAARKERG